MDVCLDYEDLFKTLNAYRIKYLVVGGQAVIYYTQPRYTKDMDVWIPSDLNRPEDVYEALKTFGAPLTGLSPKDFTDKKMILQIGVPPVRIDVMVSVPGVSSKKAWKNKKRGRYGKTPIYLLGLPDLVRAKKKAGRPQDGVDLDKLFKTNPKKMKKT